MSRRSAIAFPGHLAAPSRIGNASCMCNLYSMTKGPRAIIDLSRAMCNEVGNLEPQFEFYPEQMAPIVRNASDGVRELARVRWGLPSSQFAQMEAAKK